MGALEIKKEMVAELTEKFKTAGTIVVVDYRGMTVAQATKMRKQLREAGVDYRVVKNTLLTILDKNEHLFVYIFIEILCFPKKEHVCIYRVLSSFFVIF